MDLSQYTKILRRWWLLISVGTAAALVVGLALEFGAKVSANTSYRATSSVVVNYASPVYIGSVSTSAAATNLATHITDPNITQINPRIPGPAYSSLTAAVDPNADSQISVVATSSSSTDARIAANRAGAYLATLFNNNLSGESGPYIAFNRQQEGRAKSLWLMFTVQASRAKSAYNRAILQAKANYWEGKYSEASTNILNVLHPGLPGASFTTAANAKAVKAKTPSPIKTVLPAAIIGLMLSFLLATYLDSRENRQESENVSVYVGRQPQDLPRQSDAGRDAPRPVEPEPEIPLAPTTSAARVPNRPSLLSSSKLRSEVLRELAGTMRGSALALSTRIDSENPSLYLTGMDDVSAQETAVGLAAALALAGRRVALVDGDASRVLTDFFSLRDRPGLSDLLRYPAGGARELLYGSELITQPGALLVLPHGVRSADSLTFVHTGGPSNDVEAWRDVVQQLDSSSDIIIVAGPSVSSAPGLPGVEAAGGVLLVTDSSANQDDTRAAFDRLRSAGARILGTLVSPAGVGVAEW